jgi:hypothetical protein
MLKGKVKIPGTKVMVKTTKNKYRRNTVVHEDKPSTTLTSILSEEYKQQGKSKSNANLKDVNRRTQSMSKTSGKVLRKMSDPYSEPK